ncbi:glycosyltransferase family 2 protein [Acinetobacter ihumii]|uniref:glycosyltransferase family 2 protein n=1 Tax=Acinetobacter ihumii TaxID=2483802 RepID=UPI001BC8802F
MATYNGGPFIYEQVDSILIQLGVDDELIISDDGSTDNTINEVLRFKDNRIKVIKGPKQGIIKNFENSLKAASGDYIFLSDQDDIWLPNKIKNCINVMQENKEISLVVTDCKVVNNDLDEIYSSYFRLRNSKSGFFKNLYKGGFHGCCMCFSRSTLEKSLPFPDNIPMHDWWIGLVAEIHGKTFFLNECYLLYRRHDFNASSASEKSSNSLSQMISYRFILLLNIVKRFFNT